MSSPITGIHHVTAFAKDPRRNHEFYTRVLGLRLVKKTVNFDDPLTYHLYYGDRVGSPGSLLTHFPHPHAKPGVHGSPEIIETVLGVQHAAISFWENRLRAHSVTVSREGERISFEDHDGMRFVLVGADVSMSGAAHDCEGIGAEEAIAGIDEMVIRVPDAGATGACLVDVLGFERVGDGRYVVGGGGFGCGVRLEEMPADARSKMGAGTVHHVAWRVPDGAAQGEVMQRLRSAGIGATEVLDRQYFQSVYARIPGGVIFEFATDGPGFDVDESAEGLGTGLKLPAQHEDRREEIEGHLVPLA